MASRYVRLLDPTVLVASSSQAKEDVVDLGAYTTLVAHVRVLKAGGAGNVFLQHAAVNEVDAWVTLAGTTVALNGTGGVVSATNFLRYVRWATDALVAGAPVALIDIVAKE